MTDGVQQQPLVIYQDVVLLALDLLALVVAMRIDREPPFFRALDALAIDDCADGAAVPPENVRSQLLPLLQELRAWRLDCRPFAEPR